MNLKNESNPTDLLYWLKLARKSPSLIKIRDLQEIAITLSVKSLNPKLLSQDLLQAKGIIPADWKLKQKPLLSPTLAEVNFQNGLKIVARASTLTFIEIVAKEDWQQVNAPKIARQYLEKLPQLDYRHLQVSPRRLISLPSSLDAARQYITETLLAPGSWQEIGQSPLKAALTFVYHLPKCQLRLSIRETRWQKPNQPMLSALFFAGCFEYDLTHLPLGERIPRIKQRLENWTADFETFNNLINQKFLG